MSTFLKRYANVSLSSTFVMRARCRYCKSKPMYYFWSKTRTLYISFDKPRKMFENIIKLHKDLYSNYYLVADPSNFNKMSDFSYVHPFMKHSVRLHKNKGMQAARDYSEYVSCSCGRTIWAFYENFANTRPDIIHRKSVYKYPQKFEY